MLLQLPTHTYAPHAHQDGRIYLGGLNRREQRVGVGLTMTRGKKAFIAHRRVQSDGGVVVKAGAAILDFDAGTFRRATGAGGSPDGGAGQQEQQQQDQQGQEEEAAPVRVGEGMVLPALWDAGAVTALLSAALADPGRHWGVLATLTQTLLREARSFMEERVRLVCWGEVFCCDGESCAASTLASLGVVMLMRQRANTHTTITQPPRVPILPYSREGAPLSASMTVHVSL